MLDWARQSGCRWDERTCSWAAQGGHLAVLQWARQNGCSRDEDTCILAPAAPERATWQPCSGRAGMAAVGMRTPAPLPLLEATWHC